MCDLLLLRQAAFVLGAFLITTAAVAAVVFLFHRVWVTDSGIRRFCSNLCVAGFSLLYFLLLLDVVLFAFYTESVGDARSLTAKRWFCIHWKPLNSSGYRDEEISRVEGKHLILVLGDSFAAGHGVDDYRDRFSNVLESALGDGWAVANVARLGWETPSQARALEAFPYDPEIVVLSYYINDILDAMRSHGLDPARRPGRQAPGWLHLLTRNSYLWDYVSLKVRRSERHP